MQKRLSVSQAAKELNISAQTIYNQISDARFPHKVERYGKKFVVILDDNAGRLCADDIDLIAEKTASILLKKVLEAGSK